MAKGVEAATPPSVTAVVPAEAVSSGVSFTAVTLTCLLAMLLFESPSLTTKRISRVVSFGVSELLE